METMTSRQRVIEAINHRVPDRVPFDLGMYTASGISAFAYQNLREYLGLSTDHIEIFECVQILPRVQEDILQKLHCDCILLNPQREDLVPWTPREPYHFLVPPEFQPQLNDAGEWVVQKGKQRMRMPKGGYFFDGDWITFWDVWEDSVFKRYMDEAERIYRETDYFTSFKGFSPFYSQDIDYFCNMITDPDELIEKNEATFKVQIERVGRLIRESKGYIGAVCMSGDLGNQNGPMCRPEAFEEVVMPYLKPFCEFIHRNSDMKTYLHTCGAIEPLIPCLIEAGIDIINPVQVSANGMDPVVLNEKYGDKIVFWGGGVDTQHVLGFQSEEKVREDVRKNVLGFKPGGGYIFHPVHNIMGDVPPEQILAAYDEAYRNSFYTE